MDTVTADLPKLNTPMYEGLESNLPHMLMQYSDTPFPTGTQLFPRRETVLQYLREYASEIMSLIRFDSRIVDVRLEGGHGWKVTTRTAGEESNKTEEFDAVVAANGHCDRPVLPNIEGLNAWSERFPDSLYHSVSYKNAKSFEHKVSNHSAVFLFAHEATALHEFRLARPSCRRWPLRCRHRPSNRRGVRTSSPRRADREIALSYR